jgi:propionyl-CoA synthetase
VVDDRGAPVPRGTIGNIVVGLPLPPGALPTLWNAEDRFRASYLDQYPGFYQTSDAGMVDEDGYIHVMARTDDVINVAGHRLSTGGMEEVLASHPMVAEAAVIGVADEFKGQVPVGFVVLSSRPGADPEVVAKEAVQLVRDKIGAVASLKTVVVVKRLPKTRSGKILRRTMRGMAGGDRPSAPPTIEDATVLPEIQSALAQVGFPPREG